MFRPWVTVLTSFHNTPIFGRIWVTVAAMAIYASAIVVIERSTSLYITSVGAAFHGFLGLVLGTLLAVLLDRELRGGGVLRALALLPMFVTNVVIGLIFRILLSYDFGVVNWFGSLFGLGPVPWLGDPALAFWTLILVDAWNTTSFVALLVLAGLRALPKEPLESALVDGASAWARFRYVMFPLLRPVIAVAALWRTIDLFRIFDVVFSLTGGGPSDATETASIFVYRHALGPLNLGLASAMSFIILAVLAVLLAAESVLLRRRT